MEDEIFKQLTEYFMLQELGLSEARLLAKKIARAIRELPGKAPPAYYPNKSCRCGAERIGSKKHANWCPIG